MKEKLFNTEDVFAFRRALTPESDRGAALMAAAYLDSQLAELLRRSFVDDVSVVDELLEQSKPVGTFSSRIDLAYALGYLGKSTHRDLHLIRKIRNDFGHVPTPIGFEHPPIASRCRELTHSYYEPVATPRRRFLNTVMRVLALIHFAEFRTRHTTPAKDQPPTAEFKGEILESADKMFSDLLEQIKNDPEIA